MSNEKDEMHRELERAREEGFILPKIKYDYVQVREDAILMCARLVHSAVEALNLCMGEQTLDWKDSRDSLIAGVNRLLDNPDETPSANHDAWREYRIKEGWIYGEKKDLEKKTHPCLVSYDELPAIQKAKDMMFIAITKTFFGL
jgi:hypothetical protein